MGGVTLNGSSGLIAAPAAAVAAFDLLGEDSSVFVRKELPLTTPDGAVSIFPRWMALLLRPEGASSLFFRRAALVLPESWLLARWGVSVSLEESRSVSHQPSLLFGFRIMAPSEEPEIIVRDRKEM